MEPVPVIPLAAVAATHAIYGAQRVCSVAPWSFYHHSHRGFCELAYVETGTVLHRHQGGEDRLAAGHLVFIRERDRHDLAGERLRYFNLNLPTAEWWRLDAFLGEPDLLPRLEGAASPPTVLVPAAERQRLASDLEELFLRQADIATARRRLTAFLLAWLPRLGLGHQAGHDPRPAWLVQLLSEIDDRLEHGIVVTDLPRRAGVSAEHLARTMRRHLGCTPSAWLTRCRIERAALLLTHTNRDLGDIAEGLGFASLSWFHAEFRRRHGRSPGAYRARHVVRVAGSCDDGIRTDRDGRRLAQTFRST